eukprot:401003-Pelagomonas_calceolata.AAC.4
MHAGEAACHGAADPNSGQAAAGVCTSEAAATKLHVCACMQEKQLAMEQLMLIQPSCCWCLYL